MLPPELAAFSFGRDPAGSDESIAARVAAAARTNRALVLGAGRPHLLHSLARHVDHVVALDTSRATLMLAREMLENAGVLDSITLFAADPRDFAVPDGADAVLVTSLAWRSITASSGRRQMLDCTRKTLEGGGWLFVDVDRLPPCTTEETDRTLLRVGPGRKRWWWWRDPTRGLVTVRLDCPELGVAEVELSAMTPEHATVELRDADFTVEKFMDPETGQEPNESSYRAWLVAQPSAHSGGSAPDA